MGDVGDFRQAELSNLRCSYFRNPITLKHYINVTALTILGVYGSAVGETQ